MARSLREPLGAWGTHREAPGALGAEVAALGTAPGPARHCAAREMKFLLKGLQGYLRVTAGSLQPRPVPLGDVVAGALRVLSEDLALKGAQVDCPPDLPQVLGDPDALELVLVWLLSGVLESIPPGTRPRIALSSTLQGSRVRISIRATGGGIDVPSGERHGGEVGTPRPKAGKAGEEIGLAIARAAVERLGGRLLLESSSGADSEVSMELGRAEPGSPAAP